MMNVNSWMQLLVVRLQETFGKRLWFVGLQGSYARGEATEHSDIDPVVIVDNLSPADVAAYRAVLDQMPHRELICGFFSGREEILHWDAADLFQFYHDTKPIVGSLDALLPLLTDEAVDRAIKIGAGNIYHGCVHNMLHEKSDDMVRGLYKSASFVAQALAYRNSGTYFMKMADVARALPPEDRQIVQTFFYLKGGGAVDFAPQSEQLLSWAQKLINKA